MTRVGFKAAEAIVSGYPYWPNKPVSDDQRLERYDSHYSAQIKWDGVRALGVFDSGQRPRIYSKSGELMTSWFPEFDKTVVGKSMVLDGEIICRDVDDDDELSHDFELVAKRLRKWGRLAHGYSESAPAMFAAFDILSRGPAGLVRSSFVERTRMLENTDLPSRCFASVRMSVNDAWSMSAKRGYEGIVVKADGGIYTDTWHKLKARRTISAIVTGSTERRGGRDGQFGALHIAVVNGDKVVPIGKVGSGFGAAEMARCYIALERGEPFIVEVAYQQVTSGNQLRFPRYVRMRPDQTWRDAPASQLTETQPDRGDE